MTGIRAFRSNGSRNEWRLGDFTADRRMLLLAGMAIVVGSIATVVAFVLLKLIALITNLAYYGHLSSDLRSPAANRLGPAAVIVPVAGALLIGLMARYGSEKIRGHGIPEAMEAILIGQSKVEPKVALLKPVSSAVSIGTGGPFGAEGPIILTGGAFGSLFAQFFHLSASERKTLLVAGAAAGMSATFGTPVAAVLLAVELLLFEWKPRSFIPVAFASATAAGVRPLILDPGALFPVHAHAAIPLEGLLAAFGVGVAAGLASSLLTALVYGFEDLFNKLRIHWMWWPAIGGLVIGIGGLIQPHALGVGYDNIRGMLDGSNVGAALAGLAVVKAVIWSFSLGSGTSGGVLAPLLIIGGALGALEGHIIPVGRPEFWAMVGMGAMLGGTMRSPLTAIVFTFELTRDAEALLPLLVACSAAFAVTVLVMKRSILTEKVARRGHHVMREYVVDPLEIHRVGEVMTRAVETLPAGMRVGDAITMLTEISAASDPHRRHQGYPVVDDDGCVVGLVTRGDALEWSFAADDGAGTLGERVARTPVVGYPDEPVGRLADRMAAATVGRAPIITRTDGRLVGIASRRDILRARSHQFARESERERVLGARFRRRARRSEATDAPGSAVR